MHILILHRIPFDHVRYSQGIDHEIHDLVYLSSEEQFADIPEGLRCKKFPRPKQDKVVPEHVRHKQLICELKQEFKPFDLVIALSEFDLIEAASLRTALGVKGSSVEDTLAIRDKVVMKDRVSRTTIRTPKYVRLSALPDSIDPSQYPWKGKTILKPVDGAASNGIEAYESFELALNRVRALQQDDEFDGHKFQFDEFIEGQIFHVDGIAWNSQILLAVPSFYVGTPLGFAQGAPLASIQVEMTEQLLDYTRQSLEAVGITHSCFHLEGILSDGECVFLEVAGRMGGATIPQLVEHATGFYLPQVELALKTRHPSAARVLALPSPCHRQTKESFALFMYPGHHLVNADFCQIHGAEKYQGSPHIVEWKQLPPMKNLSKNITYYSILLPISGIARGETSEVLKDFIDEMFASISIVGIRK